MFVTIISLLFTLTVCHKDENVIEVITNPYDVKSESNSALEELALIFTEANTSDSFRNELKSDALIEYDDEFLLNYSKLKTKNNDNNIIKLLKMYSGDLDLDKIQSLVDKIPSYEVSVPINADVWDTENYTPLVAFIPENFNEKIHKKIKAFNGSGNPIWIDVNEDPTLPVILIRPKENVDLSKYIIENENEFKSARTNGGNERIKQIGTDNIGEVESWISGPRCELKCITISSKTKSIISEDYFYPKRSDINNKFYTVNHKILNWDKNVYGDFITMQWIEEDGGNKTTLSISYPNQLGGNSTLSTTIEDKDDNLGLKSISFDDNVGIEYNTGKIKWINSNISDWLPKLH